MLDNLLEIEVAYSLLKQEDGVSGGKDPLDLHYELLKTKMDVSDYPRCAWAATGIV